MTDTPIEPDPIEDSDSHWLVMLDEWARYQWQCLHRRRQIEEDWPPSWAPAALLIMGGVIVASVIVLLVLPLIAFVSHFLTDGFRHGAGWLHDWAGTRIVLDPVYHYLDTHAAGLPVDSDTLRWTWSAAGVALILMSCLWRVVAARIGWILYGAATVAMVWSATAGPGRTVAAGVAALWWTVLSIVALRRPWSKPQVIAIVPELR